MHNDGPWPLVRLGDFAYIKARIGWRGLSASEYTEDGPFLIAGQHIKGSQIDWAACDHLSWFRYSESKEIQLQDGDVILSKDGTIGRVGFVRNLPGPATINGTMMLIRPDKNHFKSRFVYYLLQGDAFRRLVNERISGSSVPHLFQRDIVQLRVPSVPLFEQKKIAEILGSVDEAIQATQAVIDQTRKVKQGLLQQLLTRGINHTRFKQTEIGQIPEDWEIKSANELCETISVGIVVKPTQYYVESGVPCFRSANVREGHVHDDDWAHIAEQSNRLLKKSRITTGDVLVVRTCYPGTSCVVPPRFDGANCVDIIFARPIQRVVLPQFLSHFINSSAGKKQVLAGQGGLAQQHFNVSALKRMLLGVPSLAEQEEIVGRTESLQIWLERSEQELQALAQLKRGLMQDLLTGRVQVQECRHAAS